jgi:hypothetical protein
VAREVIDPAGTRWRVRRRWGTGRRLPGMRWGEGGFDGLGNLGPFDDFGGIAVAILVVVAAFVLVFVVLPLAILLLELLLFVLLLLAAVAGRVLLRKPWTLEASDGTVTLEYRVSGWRNSREAIDEIAAALERGQRPTGLPGA